MGTSFWQTGAVFCQMPDQSWQKWDFFYYVILIEFLWISYLILIEFYRDSWANLLILKIFDALLEAKVLIERWRREYNHIRLKRIL